MHAKGEVQQMQNCINNTSSRQYQVQVRENVFDKCRMAYSKITKKNDSTFQ